MSDDSLATRLGRWWSASKARLEALFTEYGWTAVTVYFVIFFGTWIGFAVAISRGFDAGSAASGAGLIGGAWVVTKTTQPIRIGITVVITPFVARVARRFRAVGS